MLGSVGGSQGPAAAPVLRLPAQAMAPARSPPGSSQACGAELPTEPPIRSPRGDWRSLKSPTAGLRRGLT